MITGKSVMDFVQQRLPAESQRVKGMVEISGSEQFWQLDCLDENRRMLLCFNSVYTLDEVKNHFRLLLNGCVKHALIVESVEIPAIKFDWRGVEVDNSRDNKAIVQFAPRVSFTLSELLLGLGKVTNGPN